MKIGKDSVVIGNVPADAQVGEGCVIIGATDARGNTIINTPMAVGRGAYAGPGSIAIGAGANAGGAQRQVIAELQGHLEQFAALIAAQQSSTLSREFEQFKTTLQQSPPDKSLILKSWEGVRSLATINGAHTLLAKISAGLAVYFGS